MVHNIHSKTSKAVALFVAAVLIAAPGCSNRSANSNCIDQNKDSYCDNNSGGSSSMSRGYYGAGGGTSGSLGSSGSTGSIGDSSSGISQGSSTHGGIGSSGGSSSS
jgi:hypothetical protein